MVDVHGDGNCFFRAITHQLCYNEFHYEQIRHSAVKEVIENPERYKNFVTEGLDECIASLSRNREWANNTLLQATANELVISIKIIKDSERIPSYTVIQVEVESNTRHQHVVFGYISDAHYVATEFQEPFAPASWGGRIPESSKELVNTCSINGPLTWLVYSMALGKHFNVYIVEKPPFLMQIFELFETGDSVKGKVLWYENQINKNFNKTKGGILNMYSSEALHFFEPLKRALKINYESSCTSSN